MGSKDEIKRKIMRDLIDQLMEFPLNFNYTEFSYVNNEFHYSVCDNRNRRVLYIYTSLEHEILGSSIPLLLETPDIPYCLFKFIGRSDIGFLIGKLIRRELHMYVKKEFYAQQKQN